MSTVALALDLLISLLNQSQQISGIIAKAQAAGRTELTPDEWLTIIKSDDAARQKLIEAIAAKQTPK